MGFNEKVQAYLVAKYYQQFSQRFGSRGEAAFIHATRFYAEQRGRRMAQRAIRDGRDLSMNTYLCYGEWVNTEEIKATGRANHATVLATSPDYIKQITICPWHDQFVEMGLPRAGILYCSCVDNSICLGFNPELDYRVPQNLGTADCCYHIAANANAGPGPFKKDPKGLRSFEYHCAHSYWTFRRVAQAIFQAEGTQAADQVLAEFTADYGPEMAQALERYRNTDFDDCDSGL